MWPPGRWQLSISNVWAANMYSIFKQARQRQPGGSTRARARTHTRGHDGLTWPPYKSERKSEEERERGWWVGGVGGSVGGGAPTVVGAVPVLVPDGRAVGMRRSGHQSFLRDQTSSALIVIIHHQKGVRAGIQSHDVHALIHHTARRLLLLFEENEEGWVGG